MRRLAAYASFEGSSLTILGALTIICGGYGSVAGLLMSFLLLGTGIFEIYSVRQLRRLRPSAINHLVYNQLVLAGGLIAYGVISLLQIRHSGGMPSEIAQALAQAGTTDEINQQLSTVAQIFYAGLIAIALLIQGGTAMFYFSRRSHLQRYLNETPDWIQQMQRERGNVSL